MTEPQVSSRYSVIVVFAVLGLVVFPFAVACQSHLYADGAYFFVRILETGRMNAAGATPARFGHHVLTQTPVLLFKKCGVSDVRHLSWLYGASLYYLPWTAYAVACWLFLRAKMNTSALLVACLYCVLGLFTAHFIISESHLAASLFVLTVATLVTCNLHTLRSRVMLVSLWLLTVSVYEFWSIFFPICALILAVQQRGKRSRRVVCLFAGLYLIGAIVAAYSIVFSSLSANRDAMFGAHMMGSWKQHLVGLLCFLVFIALALHPQAGDATQRLLSVSVGTRCAAVLQGTRRVLLAVAVPLLSAAGCGMVMLGMVGRPWQAYAMRSMNLILPVVLAGFILYERLFVRETRLHRSAALSFGSLGLLTLMSCALMFHGVGFSAHRRQMVRATQAATGYLAMGHVDESVRRYGWGWTYPTLSVLVQAQMRTPVRTVIYNPSAKWEPFGPSDHTRLRSLVSHLGLSLLDETKMASQALEVAARKLR